MLIVPKLQARKALIPYVPFHESDQEWIELYNRSSHAVSLEGWKIRGGIDYDFDTPVSILPGEYLVVARDSEQLAAEYPDVDIVGDFGGRLSDKGDEIVLIDDNKNITDEVRYYDRGYWSEYSDGGGMSLELVDPDADNSNPLAWQASNETDRSTWKTYSYRAVANPSPGSSEPSIWNELFLGLLDTGEILLDDISVIEEPDGARIQLIQSGSFEFGGATWRLLGNQGLGAIIADPDNIYNHVLHLVATGATEHMHNHVETTYAVGQTVNNGLTYEISYRAKWLAGSNQLNTRLYFNRAGKTKLLDTPTISGTPGERNSRYKANMGPTIGGMLHTPAVPGAGEDITITARADDPDGVSSMTLRFSVNGGTFQNKAMTLNGSGLYEAGLDGMSSGTIVHFYIQGRDSLNALSEWPIGGSESRAMFKVDDGQAYPAPRHNFRIIMNPDDADFLHESTNVMSNHRMPATVIFNEKDIYYDVGVHIKGSGYGRNNNRAGFNVRFRPDQLFNGVHDVVATDRSGGPGGIGASHRELVVKHIGNHAGAIPCMYDDIVNTISPRGELNGMSQLLMARYDDAFLESQYDNGTEGALFEFELIYYSQNTVDGNPESLKLPPSAVLAIDFRDMGDDKEAYRWNYQIKNNRAADDFSRVIDMAKAFGMSSAQIESDMNNFIDVDQWMRVFAFESLSGIGDTYNQGLAHNLMLYVRPEDNRVLAMPWDMDFAFFQSTSASIFGGGSNLQRVIAIDRFKRLFYGHIQDIVNTTFKNEYLADWIDHYGSTCGQNVSSEILSRVDQRRNFIIGQLPVEVSFVITSNAGKAFTVDTDSVNLQGDGWINVRQIRLAGNDDPLEVTWTDLDSWEASIPLAFGQNTLTLDAYDYQDDFIASDTITVTSISSERPLRDYLRVTELMYDSAGGKDYEFIELCNTGPDPLDITHVTIGGGIEYAFAGEAVTVLQPGQFVVVVEDIIEFELRYGTDIPLAGQYNGSLGNGGEPIVIRARYNAEILAFDYNDSRSWPPAADGTGHSLVPVEEAIADEPAGSLNYGGNWRASSYIYGSPGDADPELTDGIVLNEIMAHTDYFVPPHGSNDWIELFNRGISPVALNADWYLSDNKDDLTKWSLPDMIVPAGGIISFDEVNGFHNPIDTGFGLNKAGDEIYLSYLPADGQQRVVDCIRFKGQENGVSLGRIGDGGEYWRNMIPTREQSNGNAVSDIVISEIMYSTVQLTQEYIELYNPTGNEVAFGNGDGPWRINGTVEYDFALDVSIPAGGRILVVAFDPVVEANLTDAFIEYYDSKPLTAGIDIVGPFSSDLADVTGRVAVERPQEPDTLGDSVSWVIVDEAIYFQQFPFPEISGETSSVVLQRIDFTASGNNPAAWEAAFPTPGTRRIVPADLNKDGRVDLDDYAIISAAWLTESGDTDFCDDCDIAKPASGTIDLADLAVFVMQWMR